MSKLIFALLLILHARQTLSDYWSDRSAILQHEASLTVGHQINLTAREHLANAKLMRLKRAELDAGLADPATYLPAHHFFHTRHRIAQSPVYRFLRAMPKAASLHTHFDSMASLDYVLSLTHSAHLYGCITRNDIQVKFFFDDQPSADCPWKPLAELRRSDPNFDDYLRGQFSLLVANPEALYPDINAVWVAFVKRFERINGLLDCRPILEDYIRQIYQEFFDDGITYLEIRTVLTDAHDPNGTLLAADAIVELYAKATEDFQRSHPGFEGVKFIYTVNRQSGREGLDSHLASYLRLKAKYPGFFAGFDLAGQEDLGRPLAYFAEQLRAARNATDFYFHAGETGWLGVGADLDVLDAVLLGSKRIGHGYAIAKHPAVLEMARKRNIAVEVSPVSNQVLRLVADERNHPAAYLLASGYPVVVTCDDVGFWGAKGVSYDWYMVFMGLAARDADLRMLKQLVLNSVEFSAMEAKGAFLERWGAQWDAFIDDFLQEDEQIYSNDTCHN